MSFIVIKSPRSRPGFGKLAVAVRSKNSTRAWVIFQSAHWVNFRSAPTIQEVSLLIDELSIIKSNPSLAKLSFPEFEARYPHAFKLLLETLGPPDEEVIDPVDGDLAIGDVYLKLTSWAFEQCEEWCEKLPAIVSRDRLCVPNESDKLSRYQSSLDNELYKAMRALRQAQTWRLDVLETND